MFLTVFILFNAIEIKAFDTPNDDGSSITIIWRSDVAYQSFDVLRCDGPDGEFLKISEVPGEQGGFDDASIRTGAEYCYQVVGHIDSLSTSSAVYGPVKSSVQIFNLSRLNIAACMLVLFCGILFYIIRARKKSSKLFVRRIPALNAMEEAIGRATEMGKPVLYVPGIMDIDDPQTIASMSILAKVAERTAQYGTPLYVPTSKAMAMTMAQQVVKEAATRVGRPDWFTIDNIRYFTDDQFAYVSAVDGIMVRERPATNFYLGTFYAESLILAETGHSTGAIQIAGTAMPDQLPFFVAACDYTLLGEELYAASAYLSREPIQLGSLKGQDFGKLVFIIVIIAGFISQLIGWDFFIRLFRVNVM